MTLDGNQHMRIVLRCGVSSAREIFAFVTDTHPTKMYSPGVVGDCSGTAD
jgi:hypothetical protein